MQKLLMNFRICILSVWFLFCANLGLAFMPPAHPALPNFDKRAEAAVSEVASGEQRRAAEQLQARQPRTQVEFDPITGGPKSIWSGSTFLTGSNGVGATVSAATASRFAANDPDRATKAFLLEYKDLFRHGPEVLDQARVKRQYVMPHNGLRTVVWQQEVDGIPVFEAVLISHTSRRGELVNLSDQFLPDPTGAVARGGQNRANLGASLSVSARRAVAIAAGQIDERLSEEQLEADKVSNPNPPVADPVKRQAFRASVLKGAAEAKLIWLPMNPEQVHLCWDVLLTGRTHAEMFRVLVDAQTGQPLLRRCLTEYISDATYRVFTSDSPSPLSPGYATPITNQPPLVPRTLLTISALDTNASPSGWIDDGVNETRGNNVDAHTDLNDDDQPDLPRPQGSPFRVFDFPMDLGSDPSTYRDASVSQLFYWCNWMHDRLYDLGFTEEAGNFQNDNFGRGGAGNDAVQADAQDGGGVNNANFTTPPDGTPGRMQMYVFTGPNPARDGALDAEIVLHEYTHGLSNRRVGGGVGISQLQPAGMGEGWSDFYALSLLSNPGDDVDGVYACAAYSSYKLGGLTQNYYFGIRRYPYCTDLLKNPLTFKDIDPNQASRHDGIPRNPVLGTVATEVHNMGEVWCVTLWDARANLIRRYGSTAGNQLMLQLVTDGMALSPPNPNFLQARDAILLADRVDSNGANQTELWSAFAKRGMGSEATCPGSTTTAGLQESFQLPDPMQVAPVSGVTFYSQCGQVFVPSCKAYYLSNAGSDPLNWTASATEPWVSIDPASGSIPHGMSNTVSVCLTPSANTLPSGDSTAAITFSNLLTGATITRSVLFRLSLPMLCFPLETQPAWSLEGEWGFGEPAGLGGIGGGHPDPATGATGTNVFGVNLNGDYSVAVGGPYYLTAGPFDFSNYTGMKLQFQRWLNTDYQPYVYATIEVSSDGTNWNPVWDNGTTEIADSAWTAVSYDISALADNRTNVYVRWGHRVASQFAFPYSGWNIDDIEFVGNTLPQLTVAIPPAANAGAGILTGTVTAAPAPATNLMVALTSSDASAATVPAFVIITAGQSNAVFDLTIADELHTSSTQMVLISATAPDYFAGSSNIEVSDSAAVSLYLSLPGTAIEGEGTLEGAVYIRDVQTNTLLVSLASSDTTALQVPDSVFIPIGQTSAVFTATVVDDNLIDGPQLAVVAAQAPGWITASANVVVQDNENLDLTVAVPASAWENAGLLPNAGSVSISGVLATNLTVSLASSAPDRLSVPASVMIPSGQVASTFDLTPIDNSIADGNQVITIEASAPGFTNGTAFISVLDDESPPTPSNPSPANLATNVDQASGLAWQPGLLLGGTVTNDVYFGVNPTPGPGEFVGSTMNQNWALPLLEPQTTYYWQIIARRIGVTQGPVWQFTTRGVDHFSWNTIPSPQYVNQPFSVTVTARDAYDSVVSNFTGIVSLRGLPAACSPTNSGTFADGVWQGSVTLLQPGMNASLVADDGAGHTGTSDLFDAVLTNDVSITISADPDPVAAGTSLTYLLVVANSGDAEATGVTVSNILPPNVTIISVAPSQGDWQETNGVITASLGSIPGGTNATITLVVAPTTVGDTLTNVALVSRAEVDPYLDNNTAMIETVVGPPAVSIADAAITEGTIGTTDMLFAVTLSAPSPETVSVNYSTASGSAIEGQDYLGTNGVLVLPPGVTNAFISVAVIADDVVESNESFFVNLSEPTNAVPGRAQAVGTIIDDDAVRGQLDHFAWSSFASLQYTNVPFAVTITAAAAGGNVVTGFVGTVALSVVSGDGAFASNQCSPTVSDAFTNGVWSGEITMLASGKDVQLKADDGNGHVGYSALFEAAPFNMPATVLSSPTSQAVPKGEAVLFSVIADGTPPLSYQWSFNGTNLLDATNSVLVITNVQLTDAGNYAVEVSNAFGSEESSNAVLVVGEPPAIVAQPTDQAIVLGASAAFAVTAAGTAPLDYQWSFGGTDLVGATNNLLVITNVQLSDAGSYAVSVSNAFGSANSSNALLTIGEAPAIAIQPTNQAIPVGGVATFDVLAEGTPPLSYQWSFNGTNLLDATNSVLVITNTQLSDAGNYVVEVSNAFGSEQSSNAVLVVGEPPTIVAQPADQAIRLGETAAFAITAIGTAPLDYQWSFGGTNLVGATNNVLLIPNVQLSDAGSYAVGVSNAFGSANSSNALLTVGGPPTIVIQPTNLAVPVEEMATFNVVADGTPPLSYQWSFNGTNLVDATNTVLVITNTQLSDAGNYVVEVSNAFGSEQSSNAMLVVGEPAAIVVQPADQAILLGASAAFAVTASGTAPLDYQWTFGGANLVGATNNLLVITNVQSSDAGSYAVSVSNAFGSANSSNAVLTVGGQPAIAIQPTNQATPVGGVATFDVLAIGTPPLSYQWSFNGTNLLHATNSLLVITNTQLTDTGNYAVKVSNVFGSEQSSNAVLIVGEPAAIVAQPADQAIILGASAVFEVTAAGTAPLDYQWTFGGANLTGATNNLLVITNVQLSDAGSYAVSVSNAFGSANSSNAMLTVGEAPAIAIQPTNQAIPVGGVASFDVLAEGTPLLSYQWSFNGTNLLDATNSVLVITNTQLSDAGNYAVEVSNVFGSEQSSNAVLVVGEPPAIVAQPADRTALLGASAAFAVTAAGTAPLDYQWTFGGANLLGATNNLLVITNAQSSDAGSYAVSVSNAFGSANSSNAVLTVGEPPAIAIQPTNSAVLVGGVATFDILAAGTPPLSYQWSFNGTNLLDETNSVLVITNTQLSDAGNYAVKVANVFGSEQSSNAALVVNAPPTIVAQPTDQTTLLGASAVFRVLAAGTAPLAYQWTFGSTNLPAATTNVLVITNAQLSDAGSYAVIVSNAFGITNSSNVLLTVGIPPAIDTQPTNRTIAIGGVAIFSVEAEGTPPLSYRWSFNGTNVLNVTNSVLVITNVQSSDGGSYAVEVSNAFGSEESSNAVLSVGQAPTIIAQPANQTVPFGGTATFEVLAMGASPLAYQWSLGGTNLAAATNSLLAITNVQSPDAGTYAVLVSNAYGVAQSSNATLLVYVLDHFTWNPIPSPRFVNLPFPVVIQASDTTNGLASAFAGSVALASTNGISVNPSVSGPFILGKWTGSVTVSQATTGAVLVADDGFGHLGYSTPITVIGLPSLSVKQSGGSLLISWPAEASVFTVEKSVDLSSWLPETGSVFLVGNNHVIRVQIAATKTFYRLRFIGP
jgi:uncharacterized repeat protein (TIGR01451 family)